MEEIGPFVVQNTATLFSCANIAKIEKQDIAEIHNVTSKNN